MEEGIEEWNLLFDENLYEIWKNEPAGWRISAVLMFTLNKELQKVQETFLHHFEDCYTKYKAYSLDIKTNTSPKECIPESKNGDAVFRSPAIIKVISTHCEAVSPDIIEDDSVLSSPDSVNLSTSVLNRNVLDIESPAFEEPLVADVKSPTISRRKSSKKTKLSYPELNTTDKSVLHDCTLFKPPQEPTTDLACTPINQFKVRKRLCNSSGPSNSSSVRHLETKNCKMKEEIKEASIPSKDNSDTTILLTPEVKDTVLVNVPKPKMNRAKTLFLSKWEQKKLQEQDLDEQNCSRCGNFRGFEDLSPTMCGTKEFKCPEHRKKYIRKNTPDAVWNLDFPDDP